MDHHPVELELPAMPDVDAWRRLELILSELKRRGKAVLAITHDDRYFTAADRVLRMDYGKLA